MGEIGERRRFVDTAGDDGSVGPEAQPVPEVLLEVIGGGLRPVLVDADGDAVGRDVVGAPIELLDQRRQQVRLPDVVVVEEDDELGRRISGGETPVAGTGNATVLPGDQADAVVDTFPHNVERAISGAIVEDEQLPVWNDWATTLSIVAPT